MLLAGPEDADVTNSLLLFYRAKVVADGAVFAGLDKDYKEWTEKLHRRVRRAAHKEDLSAPKGDLEVWDLMSESSVKSLLEYRDIMLVEGHRTTATGDLVADVSQSSARLRCGAWIPTLQTNTMCVLLHANQETQPHIFTPKELLMAQGHHVFEELSGELYRRCDSSGLSGKRYSIFGSMFVPLVFYHIGFHFGFQVCFLVGYHIVFCWVSCWVPCSGVPVRFHGW